MYIIADIQVLTEKKTIIFKESCIENHRRNIQKEKEKLSFGYKNTNYFWDRDDKIIPLLSK